MPPRSRASAAWMTKLWPAGAGSCWKRETCAGKPVAQPPRERSAAGAARMRSFLEKCIISLFAKRGCGGQATADAKMPPASLNGGLSAARCSAPPRLPPQCLEVVQSEGAGRKAGEGVDWRAAADEDRHGRDAHQ